MIIVSNAGPLIALGKLGQLGLLLRFQAEILISCAVYTEVVVNGLRLGASDAPRTDFLIRHDHINIIDVTLPTPLPAWAQVIDIGEAETIVLAQQREADWVLIDNMHARHAARQKKLPLKGTIGLLLESLWLNHLSLSEFELIIQTIIADPTIWISERLCHQALTRARQR